MSNEDYLKDISEIKNLMNKSSRFISLSGLSGVLAGIYALIVLPILVFWSGWIFNILSILGGILLLTHMFSKVPSLEAGLRKLSAKLMPFKVVIGIILLIVGIIRLF